MPAPCAPRVWVGAFVYVIALLGTSLLANESARPWAVFVFVASAMLAVVLWRRQNWISTFPSDGPARTRVNRSRLFYLSGVTGAMLLVLAADLRYAASPRETFGLAGILWIAGIALLLCSAFLRLTFTMECFQCTTAGALANVGNGASGRAVRPGIAQSSLEPDEFPRQHLSGRNHDRHRRLLIVI
jgi:hypothetical protein